MIVHVALATQCVGAIVRASLLTSWRRCQGLRVVMLLSVVTTVVKYFTTVVTTAHTADTMFHIARHIQVCSIASHMQDDFCDVPASLLRLDVGL